MNPKQAIRTTGTILLLLVFAIPSFVPALHKVLEDHEHKHCTAKDVKHWHSVKVDCQLCDYLLSIQPYLSEKTELYVLHDSAKESLNVAPRTVSTPSTYLQPLRGPPVV